MQNVNKKTTSSRTPLLRLGEGPSVARGGEVILLFAFLLLFFLLPLTSHAATLSKAPNNLGLVGYWSFNEGVGTKAGDSNMVE